MLSVRYPVMQTIWLIHPCHRFSCKSCKYSHVTTYTRFQQMYLSFETKLSIYF